MLNLQMGEGLVRPHVSELVINWHLTEACNYSCRYCYAKWDGAGRELLHSWDRTRRLLDELIAYFQPDNAFNPLQRSMSWSGIRLNLAGGEPLLYEEAVLRTLAYARLRGMNTSIITNGSRFSVDLVSQLAPQVSMLGLSLDAVKTGINLGIGRVDGLGKLICTEEIVALMTLARELNPDLRLKVNTVVNALNHQEDLTQAIHALSPSRWKVLRMLPVVTQDLAVSSEDFHAFVSRHDSCRDVMCVEDNDVMSESYIMIDPHGRFFQNAVGRQGYFYSEPIDQIGARSAFKAWRFAVGSYASRYQSANPEE